ncbi:MAG: type II toxin-antitoxin system VapC family toxin [Herbiconiux sp.]|uniref:type II toxin-antitoxin system VapC family toxin n=1 Tax=Herbiconiux sp. TaxID=1871186 RepID=UPI00120C9491|nr:type II toxin-antitoxin system VapC family toxin [Herbiconiux sp.]TAJ48940.1 MAG: type II toxin-antitoxin system VapC family toxin [Herbiconiux sp.]
MIIVDTNVISEIVHSRGDPKIVDWLNRQPPNELSTTAVTIAELLYGVAVMPRGVRRAELSMKIARAVTAMFDERVLPFDSDAALEYADILATRKRIGRPMKTLDAQIAAIARSTDSVVATRNVRDFEQVGVPIVDPWG